MAEQKRAKRGLFRRFVGWTFKLVLLLALILGVVFVIAYWDALHRRFVEFPREAKAWEDIRAQRQEPKLDDGWAEYRGACHSHSLLSHDCEVPFEEVLAALKKADLQFIFMSDHCDGDKADYSKGWKGLHDGVLFVRGYEMGYGFMPWGLPDETVLIKSTEPKPLAAQIEQAGGLLFYAHTEEERDWNLPELDGMEIYNIHTDFKDESFGDLLPDILISNSRYGDHVLRRVYDRQTKILSNWDTQNLTRDITGIGANDCHQNNGFRAVYTDKDTLLLEKTAPDEVIKEYSLNALTRNLLRLFPGKLEAGKPVYVFRVDPYERMLRFTNTHLLARDLSEPALLEALKEGRCFVAHDMIADARGFVFFAEDGERKAVMGETVTLGPATRLRAESPYPVRFTLKRHGEEVAQETGRTFEFSVDKRGKYRLEAELDVNGVWTPWVFANPITVVEEAPPAPAAPPVAEAPVEGVV